MASMKLKIALGCFAIPAAAAIAVILWPQHDLQPAPLASARAGGDSSTAPVPQDTGSVHRVLSWSNPAPSGTAGSDAASASRPAAAQTSATEPDTVSESLVPVAFAEPAPGSDVHLTPSQQEVLQTMRKEFLDAMHEGDMNPNNQAYYEHWKDLQADFDERFHSIFGDEAYNEYMNSALHQQPPTR